MKGQKPISKAYMFSDGKVFKDIVNFTAGFTTLFKGLSGVVKPELDVDGFEKRTVECASEFTKTRYAKQIGGISSGKATPETLDEIIASLEKSKR